MSDKKCDPVEINSSADLAYALGLTFTACFNDEFSIAKTNALCHCAGEVSKLIKNDFDQKCHVMRYIDVDNQKLVSKLLDLKNEDQ